MQDLRIPWALYYYRTLLFVATATRSHIHTYVRTNFTELRTHIHTVEIVHVVGTHKPCTGRPGCQTGLGTCSALPSHCASVHPVHGSCSAHIEY